MINTYQTSMAPPPVPPRLGRSQPFLIPAPLPSPGYGKPLIRFLVGVVMLHFLLSVGAFFFLYYNHGKSVLPGNSPIAEGRAGSPPIREQETASGALAHMIVDDSVQKELSGNLQWNKRYAVHKNTNTYPKGWVTILESGDYFVYSRVTFSKGNSKIPLASYIKLRKDENAEATVVMKAYCSLTSSSPSPQMCTATQGDIITLETGNQLSVWVQDLSLVDYEQGATAFGMYKL